MVLDIKIRNVLEKLLENKVIVMSWGISKIKIQPTELSFCVKGLKYQGIITIKPSTENDEYICSFDSNNYLRTTLSNVVDVVDKYIEKKPQYEKDLQTLLKIK